MKEMKLDVTNRFMIWSLLVLIILSSLGWTVSHDWSQVKNVNVSRMDISFSSSLVPSGTIIAFGGSSVPEGWLLCNGSNISRSEYPDLFDAINISWGEGDGSTTFTLPDLRGAFLRGTGVHGKGSPANESYSFEGPEVGKFQNDSFQGFGILRGYSSYTGSAAPIHWDDKNAFSPGATLATYSKSYTFGSIGPDGANGIPRNASETRPFNAGVNYIIKI